MTDEQGPFADVFWDFNPEKYENLLFSIQAHVMMGQHDDDDINTLNHYFESAARTIIMAIHQCLDQHLILLQARSINTLIQMKKQMTIEIQQIAHLLNSFTTILLQQEKTLEYFKLLDEIIMMTALIISDLVSNNQYEVELTLFISKLLDSPTLYDGMNANFDLTYNTYYLMYKYVSMCSNDLKGNELCFFCRKIKYLHFLCNRMPSFLYNNYDVPVNHEERILGCNRIARFRNYFYELRNISVQR